MIDVKSRENKTTKTKKRKETLCCAQSDEENANDIKNCGVFKALRFFSPCTPSEWWVKLSSSEHFPSPHRPEPLLRRTLH